MSRQKPLSSERAQLEARIGTADLMPRPAELLNGVWDAHIQADVIVSRVRCSLREAAAVFLSTSDETAALKLNKSTLGHPLREPFNQATLLQAAKVLAQEAGLQTEGLSIHKKHGPLSSMFGPDIYVVLPDEASAQKLLDHVQLPKLEPVGAF